MPLIKPQDETVETTVAEAALAEATVEIDTSASVLEPEPEPATVAQSTATDVAVRSESTAVSPSAKAAASQAAVMNEMAEAGFEGLAIDTFSFPAIVLKDGEFQIAGSTRVFDAKTGFDGVITRTRRKYVCRVGGDDDGDVVFSFDKNEFSDVNTEVGAKVAEWKANGLKPEVKEYIEAYVMVLAVHDEKEAELAGELVAVQISPTSCGRFSGYCATQKFKHKVDPDGYVTNFSRGEKVTAGKFPFYPWNFKFVSMS